MQAHAYLYRPTAGPQADSKLRLLLQIRLSGDVRLERQG